MPRRMSCSMTVDAVRERRKVVTRRHVDTWTTLKPGDRLTLIEKGMGLAKGSKQVVLGEVEIVDVRVETLRELVYEPNGCTAEGFPDYSPANFARMWATSHGYGKNINAALLWGVQCRRIEWRYLVPDATLQPRSAASGTPVAAPVVHVDSPSAADGAEQRTAGPVHATGPAVENAHRTGRGV